MAPPRRNSKSTSKDNAKDSSSGLKGRPVKNFNKDNNDYPIIEQFLETEIENVVKSLYKRQLGIWKHSVKQRVSEQVISEKLSRFYVYKRESCVDFDRRITALQFHPKDPHILAIGSKSGQLVVRRLTDDAATSSWDGIGPGGSITYITFDPFTPNSVLISSIDGTVRRHNYSTQTQEQFLSTGSFQRWYCSINATKEHNFIVTGDTAGGLMLLNKDFKIISKHKIHKGKVNSLEFPVNNGWLLASASLDCSVKLWDIRKIEPKDPLHQFSHYSPVNLATFSQTNGNRLLTTDQYKELRVYKAPLFELERSITHPHRQFQHLTPIKASWHPLCDMIVVGRYPDPNLPGYLVGEARSIDIISAETGEMKLQLDSISCSGIMSLNVFNSDSGILASAMGRYINYWKAKQLVEKDRKLIKDNDEEDNIKLPLPKPPKIPKGKHSKEKTKKV